MTTSGPPRTFADLEPAYLELEVTCQRCGHVALSTTQRVDCGTGIWPAGAIAVRSAVRLGCRPSAHAAGRKVDPRL